jgi:anti-sigma factor RsiW
MKHPIGYDDWLAYLDNQLDRPDADRVEDHLRGCEECRATWEELLHATSALRAAADEYAAAVVADPKTISSRRERVLARTRALAAAEGVEALAEGELTVRRLRRLQRVVAPACGADTAFRLIVAAVRRTPDPHNDEGWQEFLSELTDLTAALCGRSVARLVWAIGNSLA